jgi:hypothetical protein
LDDYVGDAVAVNGLVWSTATGWKCYVQNHLRFYDQLGSNFSIADANRFLADRITMNEEGNRISEWTVPFAEIAQFVDLIKPQT